MEIFVKGIVYFRQRVISCQIKAINRGSNIAQINKMFFRNVLVMPAPKNVESLMKFQDHLISLGIPWIACFQEIDTNFILIKKYNKANKQYPS